MKQGIAYTLVGESKLMEIQYAKVSRWKPPIDHASDAFPNGTFNATSFGPCCPQPTVKIYIDRQDEQFLVWIHGGALQTGCSSQGIPIIYNGTNIIANSLQPAIIVTINYRLGVLGDLYLPALVEENSPDWPTAGNYYYLDISGAKAVVDIGALKGSANLYQHIISESSAASHYPYYSNISNAIQASNKVVQNMNCTRENNALMLACLRNSSIEDLIVAFGYRPANTIVDGYFFPYYPPLAIKNGLYNPNITMIIGNNEQEPLTCFENPDMNSTKAIAMTSETILPHWLPLFVNNYQLNSCSSNRNAKNRCCDVVHSFIIDKLFDCNVQRLYNNLYMKYQQSHKLYWYHLDCNPGICPELSVEEGAGLCGHVDEIPFVFGTVSSYNSMNSHNCTWDSQTRSFSNQIISHWISMARDGEPLQPWPQYSPTAKKYFKITPYHDFSPEPWYRDCSLLDQLEDEQIRIMFPIN
ncbi:unnamed protein product [Rotaria sp. Silwood1]|nr:unnamed protein product [Rotaria sp. Silwood1]CAF1656327.1 unnamed protein product [Rotaria sp. Silwood1]CAF3855286.1 unnamed protein product [Rotaria sp. Silwood1]